MLKTDLRLHRQALLANSEQEQLVFAMLKLMPDAGVAKFRPQLAIALVVDTSMSMYDFTGVGLDRMTKLEAAMNAAHKLVDDPRLEAGDQVTIVHFDDEARVLQPLSSLWNRQVLHVAISALARHSGTTNMPAGMSCALQELRKADQHIAKRMFLLTDGATLGEEKCESIALELAAVNAPVIALGLGDTYNHELLADISALTQGRPFHLNNISVLETILSQEIDTSTREVVTNLQASLMLSPGVKLISFSRVYPSLAQARIGGQSIFLGNVASGDYTVFLMEFKLAGVTHAPGKVRLAQLGLAGHLPGEGRFVELPFLDLECEFTANEQATLAVDQEVMSYVQQRNVDHLVSKATRMAGTDPEQAKTLLASARGLTQRIGHPALTKMLDGAMRELDSTGAISPATSKTIGLGGKTLAIRSGQTQGPGALSEQEIRKLTGV